jgi:formylglycine-generating enzyme required for sulfatase activity
MNGIVQLAMWALAGVCVATTAAEPVSAGKELVLTIPGSGKVQLRMKLIPAGSFTMGEGKSSHETKLTKPFYMGVFEVTQAQWQAVMGNNPSKFNGKPAYPVERVSWEDCQQFVKKLNGMGIGTFRLPTEAEWEYACRAGTKTAYSFGDYAGKLGNYAWCEENSRQSTHQVGTKKPNAWGLYDMHGNVWEWCSDWYGDYGTGKQTDPKGAAGGSLRVNRGGCWYYSSWRCRSAFRSWYSPSDRYSDLGFRLVREAK